MSPRLDRIGWRGLVAAASMLLMPLQGWAQSADGSPARITIPKLSSPPSLDDILSDRTNGALRITGFRQREPRDGTPVSRETTAYLGYDDANLYVLFVCRDEPAGIRSRLAPREDIEDDDQVAVYLDTFHDRRHAYVFAANPNGVQRDGILTEGEDEIDYNFDTLWHTQGHITANGYAVRIAIPFRSLRFADARTQTWGIALARSIVRDSETSFWPYVTDRIQGFAQQMAAVEGFEQIASGHNAQVIPYSTVTRSRILNTGDAAPSFETTRLGRVGFDSKVVLRDSMTLDLAVKPDFSEVETNDPQVLVNRRFEVFFPEKRPLFIENAGYFQTPITLFYSRRVVEPDVGVRLTGKAGGWVVGALAANDRSPGSSATLGTTAGSGNPAGSGTPGADAAVEDVLPIGRSGGIGVLRVQREFGEQSHIGVLATSRDVGPASNRVLSADGRVRLGPNWLASGQIVGSYDRGRSGQVTMGAGLFGQLLHGGRHFTYAGTYTDLGPTLKIDELGFVQRNDIREIEQYASYLWRPEGRGLVSLGPSVAALLNVDHRGRTQDWLASPSFTMAFARQTQIKITASRSLERFQGIDFQKRSASASFSTAVLRSLSLSAFYSQGIGVNYDSAEGLRPFLAETRDGTLTLTLRPAPRVRFDEMYIISQLDPSRQSGLVLPPTRHIFTNQLLRSKTNIQFTRTLSLRTIVDYNALAVNQAFVRQEGYKLLTGDVLVTWLLHPGTAIYFGYTDQYEDERLLYLTQPVLQRTPGPSMSTARQVFVKVSYLWRF